MTVGRPVYDIEDICWGCYIWTMAWAIAFHEAFVPEFGELPETVQEALAAHVRLLAEFGPILGRPTVDTLKGSKIANLKELRFSADNGVWRVAFAFDQMRIAVLLVMGDKRGKDEAAFTEALSPRPRCVGRHGVDNGIGKGHVV